MNEILSFPERIVIELTGQCNLNCRMCPRHYVAGIENFMASCLWRKLIGEIATIRPDAIVIPFWRGESLLHPQFCEFMEYALQRRLRIHMCTNGHRMTEDHTRTLLQMEFVTFSIHTLDGFENAKKFAALRNGDSPGVQASFVDCETTMQSCFTSLINSPNLGGFNSVRVYKEHTLDGVFGKGDSIGERVFCQKLCDTLVIAVDGSISRCNHQWQPDSRLNATRMSMKEIWQAPEIQAIRDNYPDQACEKCEQWMGHTQGERWQLSEGKIIHTKF